MSLFGNNKLDKDILDSVQEVMSQQHIKMRPELINEAKKVGESIRNVLFLEDRTDAIKNAFKNSVASIDEMQNVHIMNEFRRIAQKESKKIK